MQQWGIISNSKDLVSLSQFCICLHTNGTANLLHIEIVSICACANVHMENDTQEHQFQGMALTFHLAVKVQKVFLFLCATSSCYKFYHLADGKGCSSFLCNKAS